MRETTTRNSKDDVGPASSSTRNTGGPCANIHAAVHQAELFSAASRGGLLTPKALLS